MRKLLGTVLLSGVLMTPVIMRADDHDHDHDKRVRVYDPYRRDYHEWNENENRAYRHWLEAERHAQYRDWRHASKREQREYWQWRHSHEDWH